MGQQVQAWTYLGPSSTRLGASGAMMLEEREVVSLPGDAAAARWSEDDLCSQAGSEARLWRVQARVCGPLACLSLSFLTRKVEATPIS